MHFKILERFGGVYVDIDYECIRNIDDICNRCHFFAGLSNTSVIEINNGIIGYITSPFLKKIMYL